VLPFGRGASFLPLLHRPAIPAASGRREPEPETGLTPSSLPPPPLSLSISSLPHCSNKIPCLALPAQNQKNPSCSLSLSHHIAISVHGKTNSALLVSTAPLAVLPLLVSPGPAHPPPACIDKGQVKSHRRTPGLPA
jgi:hypothetical protein